MQLASNDTRAFWPNGQVSVSTGAGPRDELPERVHGQLRRDLAGVVPAHAVGDHKQAQAGIHQERVLVGLPDVPLVREPVSDHHERGIVAGQVLEVPRRTCIA